MFKAMELTNSMSCIVFMISIFVSRSFQLVKSRRIFGSGAKPVAGLLMRNPTDADPDSIQRAHKESLDLYNKFRDCKDGYMSQQLNSALDILSDALRLYGPDQLFSSYNGGKDAVVIMHLLRAVVAKYSEDLGVIHRPRFAYYAIADEFPEVLDFINVTESLYCLYLEKFDCGIAKGLQHQIESLGSEKTPAFVLGTRRGDPNCGDQQAFTPSSSWMPAFMRVNPILDWEYGHVWHFLRTFNLPYCDLYDMGYTSLGKKADTLPNPALRRKQLATRAEVVDNSQGGEAQALLSDNYWPAYMLSDWSLERAGRGAGGVSTEAECRVSEPIPTIGTLAADAFEAGTVAGMVIIGDEILNCMTTETNMQVASKALASIGIPLLKVSIVPDDIDDICEEVRRMSQSCDIVITSGGIGPTHDDVTLKAIARALGQEIKPSEVMLAHLQTVMRDDGGLAKAPAVAELSESMQRLALLPEFSRLLFPPEEPSAANGGAGSTAVNVASSDRVSARAITEGTLALQPPETLAAANPTVEPDTPTTQLKKKPNWPVLQCDNIFVLPGIPQFFESKMQTLAKHFLKPTNRLLTTRKIILKVEESGIVQLLDKLVNENPSVKFGSYPFVDHPDYKTMITVQGPAGSVEVDDAVNALIMSLPRDSVLRVERGEEASSKSPKRPSSPARTRLPTS